MSHRLLQTYLHATSGWSSLLSTLAKACITLRFFCGKEPSIGGAVYLLTGASVLAPLDMMYCVTLVSSPAFSFNFLEISPFLPEWPFFNGGLMLIALMLDKHSICLMSLLGIADQFINFKVIFSDENSRNIFSYFSRDEPGFWNIFQAPNIIQQ